LKKYSSKWKKINHTDTIDEFPMLSEDEIINNITLGMEFFRQFDAMCICFSFFYQGVFQLKRARSYAEEKSSTTDLTGPVDYIIYRCKEFPNLIQVPTQSAHVNRLTYHPTIRFTREEILDWWYDCRAGNRFIGCCSHIASVIWFLSFERWQTQSHRMPSGTFLNFVTDAAILPEFSNSTDDSDDDNEDDL
jgi:hypothetical protein